jgi:hypothetical protein
VDNIEHYEGCAKLADDSADCDCGAEHEQAEARYNREHDRYGDR